MVDDYFGFQRQMQAQGALLSFSGYISEDVLFSLGQALKYKLRVDAADATVVKRVFAVFVEQVQNVIRYSAERVDPTDVGAMELGSGMITVGKDATHFFVVCGNLVAREEGCALRARLERLAEMDKDALRAFYREKLREPAEADSRGASIGLIEIARRSTRPIEFGVVEVSPERSFFCLKAFV